jgi:hypothetical protein
VGTRELAILTASVRDLALRTSYRLAVMELVDSEVGFDDLLDEWQQWKRLHAAYRRLAQLGAAEEGGER